MIRDIYHNFRRKSVKSVQKFLPSQFVAWSGAPRIHHYLKVCPSSPNPYPEQTWEFSNRVPQAYFKNFIGSSKIAGNWHKWGNTFQSAKACQLWKSSLSESEEVSVRLRQPQWVWGSLIEAEAASDRLHLCLDDPHWAFKNPCDLNARDCIQNDSSSSLVGSSSMLAVLATILISGEWLLFDFNNQERNLLTLKKKKSPSQARRVEQ